MISGQIDLDGLARYYGIRVPYRDLLDGIWGAEVVHAALARGDATETTRLLLLAFPHRAVESGDASLTALHLAAELHQPALVLAALRGDDVRDAGERCGRDAAGPTAWELVWSPLAGLQNKPTTRMKTAQLRRRMETAELVRAALVPWSPRTHRVQTAAFRRAAFAVMCVGQRLRGPAHASADGHARRCSRRLDLARAPPRPGLPDELWMAVLACCSRGWWTA